MELQQHLDAIRKEGLGVAAISYDSIGALKSFADRQHITYPLLSDPDSKIIRAFDILNETTKPGTLTYGIPYPGIYIVDSQGKVLSKYFEDDYKEHPDPFRRYEVGRTKWLEPYSYCPVARFVGRPGRKGRACSRPCDPAQAIRNLIWRDASLRSLPRLLQ